MRPCPMLSSYCRIAGAAFLIAIIASVGTPARAKTNLPAGFTETVVASGLSSSTTAMAIAPDGRIFVCEQGGSLRVIKNGTLNPTPFITLPVQFSGERGLLGVALDPDFATNNYVYLYQTVTTPAPHNQIIRVTANGDVAQAGTQVTLFELDNLSNATNHNGGALHFGVDGKLYAGVGDNANGANSPSLNTVLGKMLRINPDGSIPGDNPFINSATGNNRAIWATGLRNPFSFAVQPGTGTIYINDVGENRFEEINNGLAGANYGWPGTEGYTSAAGVTSPLYAYPHGLNGPFQGFAITGGAFYNPDNPAFGSAYIGQYFFSDYIGRWIDIYDPTSGNVANFATGVNSPVDLQIGMKDGALYYLGQNSGAVYRISAAVGSSDAPEPGTLTLAAVGLGRGFMICRRRKRR